MVDVDVDVGKFSARALLRYSTACGPMVICIETIKDHTLLYLRILN